MGLSKKQRKHWKKVLEVKFDQMGIADEILLVPTGKTVNRVLQRPDAPNVPYQRPVVTASNTRRNVMKKLLKLSESEIERFIAQQFQIPSEEEIQNEIQETTKNVSEGDS
jgi:hypothetical protein